MALYLEDNPYRTISVSVDDALLERLNDVARRCPELGSRSQLIRELLELGLGLLENPIETLPLLVGGIRENLEKTIAESVTIGTA